MSVISFAPNSRLLVFAPHPDDESLACGIVLQHAVQTGAAICVVYLTDGENNPWPQRCLTRRWRLDAADRQRWAKLRRSEALAALCVLGVSAEDARFLGWPDQGLTSLLRSDPAPTLARLRYLMMDWSPTVVVGPDVGDRHADHKAVGVMLDELFSHDAGRLSKSSAGAMSCTGAIPDFFAPRARCRKLRPRRMSNDSRSVVIARN